MTCDGAFSVYIRKHAQPQSTTMAKAHIPHASELLEVLHQIKVATRALASETSGRTALVGMVCDLENKIHQCILSVEECKQDFMDDYATTIFQTHHQQHWGEQSKNPFLV